MQLSALLPNQMIWMPRQAPQGAVLVHSLCVFAGFQECMQEGAMGQVEGLGRGCS